MIRTSTPQYSLVHHTLLFANLDNSSSRIKFIQVHFHSRPQSPKLHNLTLVSHYCLPRPSVALLGNHPHIAQPHIGFPFRVHAYFQSTFGKPSSHCATSHWIPTSCSHATLWHFWETILTLVIPASPLPAICLSFP